MTGHDDPDLTDREWLNLRTYLQNGGTLVADACCSSPQFDRGFRKLIAAVLPNDRLERVPANDSVFAEPFRLNKPPDATHAYTELYGQQWAPLFGIRREGRWMLLYSPVDLSCALQDDLEEITVGYRRDAATRLIANMLCRLCSL